MIFCSYTAYSWRTNNNSLLIVFALKEKWKILVFVYTEKFLFFLCNRKTVESLIFRASFVCEFLIAARLTLLTPTFYNPQGAGEASQLLFCSLALLQGNLYGQIFLNSLVKYHFLVCSTVNSCAAITTAANILYAGANAAGPTILYGLSMPNAAINPASWLQCGLVGPNAGYMSTGTIGSTMDGTVPYQQIQLAIANSQFLPILDVKFLSAINWIIC